MIVGPLDAAKATGGGQGEEDLSFSFSFLLLLFCFVYPRPKPVMVVSRCSLHEPLRKMQLRHDLCKDRLTKSSIVEQFQIEKSGSM